MESMDALGATARVTCKHCNSVLTALLVVDTLLRVALGPSHIIPTAVEPIPLLNNTGPLGLTSRVNAPIGECWHDDANSLNSLVRRQTNNRCRSCRAPWRNNLRLADRIPTVFGAGLGDLSAESGLTAPLETCPNLPGSLFFELNLLSYHQRQTSEMFAMKESV